MTETSPSKSHEGDLCWNCAHLGGCLQASGRVKRCGKFKLWEEPAIEKPLPRAKVAKICGLNIRTVTRYSKNEWGRKKLESLFRAKGIGVMFRPDRVWKGTQVYQIYVIGREKV